MGRLVVVLSVVCGYRVDEVGLALEVSLVHMSSPVLFSAGLGRKVEPWGRVSVGSAMVTWYCH